jgi:hypothetical protein
VQERPTPGFHCAADAIMHRNVFMSAEHVFDGVICVAMCGNEIDWHALLVYVAKKLGNPMGGGG